MATGIPLPLITWYISDTTLLEGANISMLPEGNIVTSYFDIQEVTLDYLDATVTCVAGNIVGNVSATASLDVLCKETTYLMYIPPTIYGRYNLYRSSSQIQQKLPKHPVMNTHSQETPLNCCAMPLASLQLT